MPTTVATISAAAMSWTPRRRSMQQQHLFMDMLVDLVRREKFTTFVSPSRHLGKTLTNGQGFRSGERKKNRYAPSSSVATCLGDGLGNSIRRQSKALASRAYNVRVRLDKKIKTLARRKQYTECEKFRKETNGPNSKANLLIFCLNGPCRVHSENHFQDTYRRTCLKKRY